MYTSVINYIFCMSQPQIPMSSPPFARRNTCYLVYIISFHNASLCYLIPHPKTNVSPKNIPIKNHNHYKNHQIKKAGSPASISNRYQPRKPAHYKCRYPLSPPQPMPAPQTPITNTPLSYLLPSLCQSRRRVWERTWACFCAMEPRPWPCGSSF